MEEKKEIKVSLGIVICLIIIVILIMSLIGVIYYYNNKDVKDKNNIKKENEQLNTLVENIVGSKASNVEKKIKKVDESKEVVYNTYSKKIDNFIYTIPYINIDSPDVERINNEIDVKYRKIISEIDEESVEYGIDYTQESNYYVNGDVVSLVIEGEFSGGVNYDIYNVDMYTGKVLKNSDILRLKNITEETFLNKLPQLYSKKYIEMYGEVQDDENIKEFYDEQLKKTLDESNFSSEVPMYLNKNGDISIIANIYSLAGADSYNRIIDTGI